MSEPAADAGRLSMNATLLMQTDAVLMTQALQAVWLSVMCICAQPISCVFVTAWTVACQAPLSLEFSRQEYQSRLPFPTPGHLPDTGIEPTSLGSLALAGRLFTTGDTWEAPFNDEVPIERTSS